MPYSRLLYHVIWATRHRAPSISEDVVDVIERAIVETSRRLDVAVYGVGIMPDHVHVFAQVPPTLAVAKVIGQWKGASSHAVNSLRANSVEVLAWQSGYGVLSVSQSGFDRVLDYVQNQRARHAARELYGVMERCSDDE
ncbi:MAG: IS200/IS605 family transposase [Thermomicrobiales bacterium]